MTRKYLLPRLIASLAFCSFIFATLSPAHAFVIYDWTGDCATGCTGGASATLTLNDTYVPGSALLDADFFDFAFTSSGVSFSFSALSPFGIASPFSNLPAISGPAPFSIEFFIGDSFTTTAGGNWDGFAALAFIEGSNSDWVRRVRNVPEPGTIAIFCLGLAGLGFMRRRRRAA